MSSLLPFVGFIGNTAQCITGIVVSLISFVIRAHFIHIVPTRDDISKIHNWLYKYHSRCSWYITSDTSIVPGGFVMGRIGWRPFLAFVSVPEQNTSNKESGKTDITRDIYVVTWCQPEWANRKNYDENGIYKVSEHLDNSTIETKTIEYYQQRNSWVGVGFESHHLSVPLVAKKWQLDMIETIRQLSDTRVKNYKTPGCVVYLCGPPGVGKTEFSKVLTCALGASLIPRFSPCKPGHWLPSLLKLTQPTKEKPLVVCMDEGDILLKKVNSGEKIEQHKWFELAIKDKPSWNGFFDDCNNLYSHVYFIMTGNTSISSLNNIDASLMRNGRFNHIIQIGNWENNINHYEYYPPIQNINENEAINQELQFYSLMTEVVIDKKSI